MKFERFDLYTYTTKLKKPLGNLTNRSGILIQAFCGKSSFWSEVAPLEAFSRESLAQAQNQLVLVLKTLIHQTVDPEDLRTFNLFPSVFFGLSSLFLQKKHKKTKLAVPLCRLIYDSIHNIKSIDAKTIKIKLGSLSIDESINLIRKIQKNNQSLRLDINKKWSLDEALYFSKHFSKRDFEYIEEPCKHFSDTCKFSKQSSFPIAIDESCNTISFSSLKDLPSLKALVYKPTILGDWKNLLENLPQHVDMIFSSSFESGIGLFSIAHLADFLHKVEKPVGLDTYRAFESNFLHQGFELDKDILYLKAPNVIPQKLCLLTSVL